MLKPKSHSREVKDTPDRATQHALNRRNRSKDSQIHNTVQPRNFSNQYIPLSHNFVEHQPTLKHREFSSHKNNRKQAVRGLEVEAQGVRGGGEGKQKRPQSSKNFMGVKLNKKLQRYMLFLSLVNYSLRVSYLRSEVKVFKVYIGRGNNSKLIRQLFSNRFWWQLTEDQKQANLVWTQRSKKRIFKAIPIADLDSHNNQLFEMENPVRRKVKAKKREGKKQLSQQFQSILCEKDKASIRVECKKESFQDDLKGFLKKWKQDKRSPVKLTHNHIEHHRLLTNKKNLFYNLRQYCDQQNDNIFKYVPWTLHIKENEEHEYEQLQMFEESEAKSGREKVLWIVKPGENSNRGCGIQVCKKIEQVKKHIEKQKSKHPSRTFIVQKYISPYLFHRRKFDIRCFVLVTSTPLISAYFYPHGYIRTSSFEFTLKNCNNKYIHLTNDAIQKKASEYSKYEEGNKVTFEEFQKYLEMFETKRTVNFLGEIVPLMKQLVVLSVRSTDNFSNSTREHTFEILGYDFMLDEDLHPWLIEINTNPCLETNCEILSSIIPSMVQNSIKIGVDAVFKPPKIEQWPLNQLLVCEERLLEGNKFQLVYSQVHD